jgi:centromeric protein E
VFDSNTSTTDVYEQTVRSIVQSTMLGYNGTIFAYGQTSSGKTHTIMGQQDNPGVIAMALEDIFSTIENVRFLLLFG